VRPLARGGGEGEEERARNQIEWRRCGPLVLELGGRCTTARADPISCAECCATREGSSCRVYGAPRR
jgi:hypothetical protein